MAEYILNVAEETSKLDWAMPFQRTGAFPLDRSVLFSSYADAEKYATGDGSDERALGGTSYVGQIISVLEDDVVNAYIITNARGLMKLASTTTTGDLATDVSTLQTQIANVYTKAEADAKITAEIAKAPHMVRKIVDDLAAIEAEKDSADALKTIYMVPAGTEETDGNKYYEYIVIEIPAEGEGETTRQVEKVGSWSVDLSNYVDNDTLTAALANKASQADVDDITASLANKANKATTLAGYGITDAYTKTQAEQKIAEVVADATGGESAASVLANLTAYKTSNDARVEAVEEKITTLENAEAEKNYINSASEDFTVGDDRKLSLNNIAVAKVTNLQTLLDAKATKEEHEFVVARVGTLETKVSTLETDVDALKTALIWVAMTEPESST